MIFLFPRMLVNSPCEGSLFPVTDGAYVLVWLGPLQEVQGEPAPCNSPDPLRCSPSSGTPQMLLNSRDQAIAAVPIVAGGECLLWQVSTAVHETWVGCLFSS